jgi:transposase-like protein
MKFLKEQESEEPKEEKISVNKLMNINMQCLSCDEWSYMEGGPIGNKKAKFLCSKCGKINTIDWKLDI